MFGVGCRSTTHRSVGADRQHISASPPPGRPGPASGSGPVRDLTPHHRPAPGRSARVPHGFHGPDPLRVSPRGSRMVFVRCSRRVARPPTNGHDVVPTPFAPRGGRPRRPPGPLPPQTRPHVTLFLETGVETLRDSTTRAVGGALCRRVRAGGRTDASVGSRGRRGSGCGHVGRWLRCSGCRCHLAAARVVAGDRDIGRGRPGAHRGCALGRRLEPGVAGRGVICSGCCSGEGAGWWRRTTRSRPC